MSDMRKYLMNFLFRTSVCLCLLVLCYIIYRLWPNGFGAMKEKLFYSVNYGLLLKELKELGRCVLPG